MKQFILIAYDAKDADALNRRMASREAHLASIVEWKAKGNILLGMALLNDAGQMHGSLIVTNFADRAAFDAWLAADPYITGKVWQDITVTEGKLPPTFSEFLPKGIAA